MHTVRGFLVPVTQPYYIYSMGKGGGEGTVGSSAQMGPHTPSSSISV